MLEGAPGPTAFFAVTRKSYNKLPNNPSTIWFVAIGARGNAVHTEYMFNLYSIK